MRSSLGDKIRKAREFTLEAEGWKLRLRRPTDAEAARILRTEKQDFLAVASEYVIDWEDVCEADLVASGSSDPIPFDRDAWSEIVVDRPELWQPIADAVIERWMQHNEARGARSKN